MIIHEGPIKRQVFKKEIMNKLNKYRSFVLLIFFGLPILVYLPFNFKWFSTSLSKGGDIAAVALVNTGDGTGSAFLISPSHLITARHVVSQLKENDIVQLIFDKSEPKIQVDAKVLFISNKDDQDFAELELLKPLYDHPTLSIGNMDNVSINDEVTIIGYPNGIFSSAKAQITNNEIADHSENFLMAGGAWPGSSGGPVIHKETGEVVGILIGGYEGVYKGMIVGQKINTLRNDTRFKP